MVSPLKGRALLAEISMTTNPLEGVLSADQIDALVTAAEDLGEGRNAVEELLSRMTRAVLEGGSHGS